MQNTEYEKKDWDKWSLFLDPLWFLLLPLAVSHSLAAIESHPREGGKVTVVELSTRLSLNHGIISPLRLTTLKKSMKTQGQK